MKSKETLKVALGQMAPVWLDKVKTLEKLEKFIAEAGKNGAELVVFGEALLPGYPFWVEHTNGAKFESSFQKDLYAHYLQESVKITQGDLDSLCEMARTHHIAVITGIIENAEDRGGHSVYCSLVHISNEGLIINVHRKLMPTYEERLVWSTGDGEGLRVFPLPPFNVGALNCWENWMPLPRTSLYAQGEDLHVAIWPGSVRNTEDITRFIAKEGRSYVISVSALMTREHVGDHIPHAEEIRKSLPEESANGGSCIAGPDGQWVVEPVLREEKLIYAELNIKNVYRERQNFDPTGHYSRPDVLKLRLNRSRGAMDINEN